MHSFQIIQGGMGVAVSHWGLAHAVSSRGQLGVVSGTGVAAVVARRLQIGDPGGHVRRALAAFPYPHVAQRIVERYFIEGGKAADAPFAGVPMPHLHGGPAGTELAVAANFVEVYLAKHGHANPVGINYLEKVQVPHLPSLFGAMLAGVDYVLMGAGIPRFIPGVLDALAAGQPTRYRLDVDEAQGEEFHTHFSPAEFAASAGGAGTAAPLLKRPRFLAIISSATLAMTLARKSNGTVEGFIVETSTAGGHNAPPRGPLTLNARGEPLYGPRDDADLEKIKGLGLPFFLAGGFGHPGKLREALALGAAGIQVGTAFAFCEESGLAPTLRAKAIALAKAGKADVFTDPLASPTGFPIKVLRIEGTVSQPEKFDPRARTCDLGYLRKPYRKPDGTLGYRCGAEPVQDYLAKGGALGDTHGRKCLCNALFANIDLPQIRIEREGTPVPELPLITAGNDAALIQQFLPAAESNGYHAADVLERLLTPTPGT